MNSVGDTYNTSHCNAQLTGFTLIITVSSTLVEDCHNLMFIPFSSSIEFSVAIFVLNWY